MAITMYGIRNCDTIKKSRKWLEANNFEYEFHDYRVNGLTKEQLQNWCEALGWEQVLNKRGTTYRQLTDEQKSSLSETTAIELLLELPAMIKRPLLDVDGSLTLGFKADNYAAIFDIDA
ncbi:Putative arsenate reductase [Moritella viscosa]|uniref:ArsC family reductase n=1 Tax=Moritella viscosa TaxID=80854 RepID=UPI000509219E|nr:ArsC family reductase [Moritella viscosa]CED59187.1 putative arsenate reductase [Moritella viscosa]SHO00261.1 Putative arsenate reductase [Moritella viscosa]SHO20258.1 Putative arsenate reductase [Moritella viscosa]